jgi:cyclopropane-fatty-acyl-phospholipid synthase
VALERLLSSAHIHAAATTLQALDGIFGSQPRDFTVRLWSGDALQPTPGRPSRFTLVLTHPGALRRMLWPPSQLTLGEAFVRGDCDVEGDLVAAFELRDRLSPSPRTLAQLARLLPAALAGGDPALRDPSRSAELGGRVHHRARDAAAVRHHYDLGNDFYALWLDRRMVYSCGYFARPDVSIDVAQEAKLELLCRKLRLGPGERFLDVGCGWGGLVIHAAQRYGASALGITLSPPQAELARARIAEAGLQDRCRVELVDYRDLREGPFDKIVSVGMVEHVGEANLPTYFQKLAALLRPGGAFLNHGIAANEPPPPAVSRVLKGEGRFLHRYVFPDTELPPLHATARAALGARLELRDVESLREHYALTLRQWLSRLEQRRADAVAIAGEEVYRTWRLYLAGSVADFEKAAIGIYQALYVKPDEGRSRLPLGRGDWYAAPLPGAGDVPAEAAKRDGASASERGRRARR